MRIIKVCKCGKEFETTDYRIKSGRGKFCSKECKYKYTVRKSGLKYTKHKDNPTSFKRGLIPWNKGTEGVCKPNGTSFKKVEHKSIKTEFTSETTSNANNNKWRGDDVGYYGLHQWIARRLGKANHCCFCDGIKAKKYYWHNISLEYKRDIDDWQSICPSCHKKLHNRLKRESEINVA